MCVFITLYLTSVHYCVAPVPTGKSKIICRKSQTIIYIVDTDRSNGIQFGHRVKQGARMS